MARLSALLPGTEVGLTDDFGVSGDDMEALAFALAGVSHAVRPCRQPAFGDRRQP